MVKIPTPSSITARLCIIPNHTSAAWSYRRRVIPTSSSSTTTTTAATTIAKNNNIKTTVPIRRMASNSPAQAAPETKFGPYEVTTQVFHRTAHSFALVNIKPLLPGHVLVCPLVPHRRLTDLTPVELTDLFSAVQRIQHMLARKYFSPSSSSSAAAAAAASVQGGGSFNIAVQDGPEAGQTVPHVHVHVIPRPKGGEAAARAGEPDELYVGMANEDGNVGGALWDLHSREAQRRPLPGGGFPKIEDADRVARSMAEMEAEAAEFRELLRVMEDEKHQR
ncbi:hypothetical protein MCOR25_000725 [Pyricularia grisea]|uniref:Bis(5'-adenosyl)-triphosphatase n=1 Tax=Pyricularia grisea TaxID=148305 RepID=A0A6P8BDB8_PYRGI|nr:uncharacterized protein PgNI_03985 [Pyricularia grisea]KAI6382433.1 hypothetical protein MCOR25_000725 [Pyricularia grisea]TLD13662.1 hypothetical protein PgNI_03985 [Pyricularia grisea]